MNLRKLLIKTATIMPIVILLVMAMGAENTEAALTRTDVTMTDTADLCFILLAVRGWMIYTLPGLAILMVGVSALLWVTSGAKEDLGTQTKNIIIKLTVGVGFASIIATIFYFMVEIINPVGVAGIGLPVDATEAQLAAAAGAIQANCSFDFWNNTGTPWNWDNINESTVFSSIGTSGSIAWMVRRAVDIMRGLVGLIASIMMLWGGFMYVLAVGPEGATKGRNAIMYGALGVFVVWFAGWIINLISSFVVT